MKLLEKLESLLDEATALVREERARRNVVAIKAAPAPTVNPPLFVPLGPNVPFRTVPPDWAQPWVPPYEVTCGTTITHEPPIAMTAWNAGCNGAINLGQVWTGMTGPQASASH